MKNLLGKKIGMTQIFNEQGMVVPVTVIQAGPCFVTQVKTSESDGYNAVQIGFETVKEKRLSRGEKGHLGLLKGKRQKGEIPALRFLREFRTNQAADYEVGQQVTVEAFAAGERVDVTGKTKGRGFAGVVKRYGFGGGIKTHGQSDRWRAPGSIGATSGTAHVFKGKKMPGRMGNKRFTAQNLEVVSVDTERNLIAVKGSVPGAKGGLVIIRGAAKS